MNPKTAPSRLLWIGDPEHPDVAPAWRLCRSWSQGEFGGGNVCDGISFHRSLQDVIARPPESPFSHVLIAQTDRHTPATLAIDDRHGWSRSSRAVAATMPQARCLVLRGPRVAPPRDYPLNNTGGAGLLESITTAESRRVLPIWFSGRCGSEPLPLPRSIVVISPNAASAASYLEAIEAYCESKKVPMPPMSWQKRPHPSAQRGSATLIWDDEIPKSEVEATWDRRIRLFPESVHLWLTGNAIDSERQLAINLGVTEVIDKPCHLSTLVANLERRPPPAIASREA